MKTEIQNILRRNKASKEIFDYLQIVERISHSLLSYV